jgi:hypothetical protein
MAWMDGAFGMAWSLGLKLSCVYEFIMHADGLDDALGYVHRCV